MMSETARKIWRVLNMLRRGLGALPVLLLGAAVGAALFWGLSPYRAAPTVATAGGHEHASGAAAKPATIWTCSMHPEVRLPKPGLCPKCHMKLIPLESTETAGMRVFTTSEAAKALMNIETAPVQRMFPTAEIRMVGKVDYDESRLAYITAWVPGRLDRLFVDYTGIAVKKGDHMVSIYSPELYSAQEELLQARQAVQNLQRSEVDIVRRTVQATVEAAREKLRLLGLSDQQVAQVEQRGKADDHVTINAPAGGIVIHKNAQEGMYVQTGTRIYTIADLSTVWVKLDAYESDLIWLRYGQKAEFTSVSYPGETFTGTIAFIDPMLNPVTRTVKVRVNVPNPNGKLKPDMFVNGVVYSKVAAGGRVLDVSLAGKWISPMHPEIVKDGPGFCDVCGMPLVKAESAGYVTAKPTEEDKPLVIPVSAALVTGTRAIVYVEKPGADKPTVEGREIVLGPRAGGYYLVRHGLAEGERVVARGNFKIDSALQIQAKPSMMTPDGGGGSSGHDHGGGAKPAAAADTPAAGPKLPTLFLQQVQMVVSAARKANEAASKDDLRAARDAFAALAEAIQAVDMKSLTGHPHMMWMELSMRLGNDAFEGKEAKTLEEVRRAAQSLKANTASLQSQFGLGHGEHAEPTTGPAAGEVSESFRSQLQAVYDGYFVAAQALAGDDAAKAAGGFAQLRAALAKVDMSLATGETHGAWMKHKAALDSVLAKAPQAKDLKTQREWFAPLSDEMIALVRRFGGGGKNGYVVIYCPMAFDGRGGTWLQGSLPVRNPYFGAAMLECGEVKDTLRGK